jgi:hypothetical protein
MAAHLKAAVGQMVKVMHRTGTKLRTVVRMELEAARKARQKADFG